MVMYSGDLIRFFLGGVPVDCLSSSLLLLPFSDTLTSGESWGFTVGDNGASMMGDIMWFGPLKPLQNIFMRTPLVNIFIAGSEIYHDYYRWPLKDRRVFEEWKASTDWGRLFEQYATRRPLAQATGEPQVRAHG